MTVFTFYFPSNGDHDQDSFIRSIWDEHAMEYLIYVRRVSLKGNPYIKGLFILNDESFPLPPEFEVNLIPDDCVECLQQQFKEEQEIENNATEYGRFPTA